MSKAYRTGAYAFGRGERGHLKFPRRPSVEVDVQVWVGRVFSSRLFRGGGRGRDYSSLFSGVSGFFWRFSFGFRFRRGRARVWIAVCFAGLRSTPEKKACHVACCVPSWMYLVVVKCIGVLSTVEYPPALTRRQAVC